MYGAEIVSMSCSPKGFWGVKNSLHFQLRFSAKHFSRKYLCATNYINQSLMGFNLFKP